MVKQRWEGPRLQDGTREGFFLADGAGCGKGRTCAALILDARQVCVDDFVSLA